MVRSMLKTSRIPKEFWPEAVNWSVHVLNRSPTVAVKHMTPEEAWSNRKPTVDHFRVFGCVAYSHVPDERRRKLDDKGVKCIFLGSSWDWSRIGQQQVPLIADEGRVDSETNHKLEAPNESPSPVAARSPSEVQPVSPRSPRAQRERKRPAWMMDYESGGDLIDDEAIAHLALFSDCDPITYKEAAKETKWREVMDAEMNSIEKNDTWELTKLPKGQQSIGVKWVYKTKLRQDGEVDKYKARLVAKGYKQKFGVDYQEVFAPVAKLDTVWMVLCLAAQNSWPVYQLDVKSAFLHGELEEEVYINQPPGYVKQVFENQVYRLKKALYGLKQAPRAWYSHIDAFFVKEGFCKCPYEHTLYTKLGDDGRILVMCLYVDDLIYTSNNSLMLDAFKKSMMEEFDMTDLGLMRYFLGIEILQSSAGIFISQKKYALEVLERFKMGNCNSVCTPTEVGLKLTKNGSGKRVNATLYKQIVGSLMYLTTTRPDIMFAVSMVSRYMEKPMEDHLVAVKRILRYLKGTADLGIFYKKFQSSNLCGFTDSDYAGDMDDRKSTSGFVFMMGSGAISWSAKKQQIVTLSTTEAEFVAAASSSCQAIWLRRMLGVLQNQQQSPTIIYCDNSSSIKLSKNSVLHGRSKHIDVRYHFLRDLMKEGAIELVYCPSNDQVADILTKPLKSAVFVKLRGELGMCSWKEAVDYGVCGGKVSCWSFLCKLMS
ncbi:putative RNA-directed DNA polymerase [Rosa chinensis]|uniref:Putative RNA-directed DNA polymerase n=1 Tax=Rosa chinensis TaxID=74649 RepID=A0A2P6SBD8_ROSCH|nr:putative RNA-directed DNA polymerase [Rosa chinensis]